MRVGVVASVGALAVVGVLALAGCSNVQSTKDACAVMTIAVQDLGAKITTANTDSQSDQTKGAKEFLALQKDFHKRVVTVHNPQVRKVSDKADADLKKFITAVLNTKDSPTDANKKTVQSVTTALTGDLSAIGNVCKG